jgi:hypothetical protein
MEGAKGDIETFLKYRKYRFIKMPKTPIKIKNKGIL